MHTAKTIAITGSIERGSTLGVQKAHRDDTKAYGVLHLVSEIVRQRSAIAVLGAAKAET